MSELSFEQMLEESFKSIGSGDIVEGKVLDVKPTEAILNIGYKSDGILYSREYSNEPIEDLREHIKVGETMEVKVLKLNDNEGQVLLSHKRILSAKSNEILEQAYNNQEVLKGKVSQILSGGVIVVVSEAKVFIPSSLLSDTFQRDLSKFKDSEIEFVITEFNPRRNRIIGDRKHLILEKKAELRKELFSRVGVGDTVEGEIKNITKFGAFVDIGGVDGLLHISEISWNRIANPSEVFEVGQKVKVFIKDIRDDKIALSMKFPEDNPWNVVAQKYKVGDVVKGKVARMTDFGVFVEIEDGIDGLLHVSQISYDHIEKPSEVYKVGDEVEAKIVDFNLNEHKISLSVKVLLEPPAETTNPSEPNEENVSSEPVETMEPTNSNETDIVSEDTSSDSAQSSNDETVENDLKDEDDTTLDS